MKKKIITGITGASGSIYALNFITRSAELGVEILLVCSQTGRDVFRHETGEDIADAAEIIRKRYKSRISMYDNHDIFSDIASGSYRTDGMVIIPCSMKTLSAVAHGASSSLLERAADVTLKERRPLILTVRETPLSLIHLKNMTAAAEAGAVVLPASPGFYHGPTTIDQLADFITGKIFDMLRIEHTLNTRWINS